MSAPPGLPGSQASNDGDLMRMIQDLQRDMRELRAANPFAPMGMKPIPNGVELDGTLNVNGPMAVSGTLSLPAGIINNDALSSPVQYGSVGPSQTNFLVDTTHRLYASAAVTVPSGYSKATILTVASVSAMQSTSNADYLNVAATAGGGVAGGNTLGYGGPTTMASASAAAINTFSGLSGGTITVGCYVWSSNFSWGTNGANIANVNAIALFTR